MKTTVLLFVSLTLPLLASAQPRSDEAVEALRSPDVEMRKRALAQLARAGHPQAAGAVAALVADGDAGLQLAALDTLLTLLSSRATQAGLIAPEDVGGALNAPRRAFERGDRAARPVPGVRGGPRATAAG